MGVATVRLRTCITLIAAPIAHALADVAFISQHGSEFGTRVKDPVATWTATWNLRFRAAN
jgi:hypothetical protein